MIACRNTAQGGNGNAIVCFIGSRYEIEDQVADTSSELHVALDTIGEVIEENSEVIEDALKEGLNKLR